MDGPEGLGCEERPAEEAWGARPASHEARTGMRQRERVTTATPFRPGHGQDKEPLGVDIRLRQRQPVDKQCERDAVGLFGDEGRDFGKGCCGSGRAVTR